MVTDDSLVSETRAPDISLYHNMPAKKAGVTRRVGSINSALYGVGSYANARALSLSSTDLATLPWVGFVEEQDHYITMKWLHETMRDRPPSARMVNTDLMAAAASEGVGVAILPCFIGGKISGLVR